MDIHKEKVARREIGALASSKNITRAQKVVAPTQKERPQKFMRSRLDFSALDHIGHGIKVTDSTSGITKRYANTAMEVRVCVCVCVCVQVCIGVYICLCVCMCVLAMRKKESLYFCDISRSKQKISGCVCEGRCACVHIHIMCDEATLAW